MPPRKKQTDPTPVASITHGDKRTNLPTADAQEFVTPAVEEARKILVERDPSLDPQLVWRGKYGDESPGAIESTAALVTDAPPIYIQEKIDPRVLVENLRRTAPRSEDEPALTLFDMFDGLDELDLVDFYEHQANWSNRMILGDGLLVMASLAEREELRGQVQMVYIDPPYGIRFESNWQATARSRSVKDGKVEDIVREAEQIKAFRDTWDRGIHSYLSYLRDRLLVTRELLTESGSCFVQIGTANLHLVTTLMAEVFGPENHVETIAFRKKTMPLGGRLLEGAYDYIVWFAKDKELVKYRRLFQKQDIQGDTHWNVAVAPDGSKRTMNRAEINAHQLLPEGTDVAQLIGLYPVGAFETGIYDYEYEGRTYKLPPGKSWPSPRPGMDRLALAGRLQPYDDGNTLRYVLRHSDYPVTVYNNVWTDTSAATGMTYVVETSPKVIQRCMLMCTDPGDLVLDPTCGSGTTAYVAEHWGRRWITIDTSRVALALARQRLMGGKYPFYLLADSEKGRMAESNASGTVLPPARVSNDIRHGFVYKRVQHITLKSIANNPDIRKGMTRDEIDEAIKRHADFELLYDDPYDDKGTVRVTGPFTVESLSPHRSLAFAGGPDPASRESISEMSGAEQPDAPNFEQSILENLGRAGVQNGRRGERIGFASIDSYPGKYIQAVGTSTSLSGEGEARIGIAIGPQYGTVSQRFARDAVKEAIEAQDIDLLCLLGFAFDAATAEVTESDGVTVDTSSEGFAHVEGERAFGRIKLLMVRMNVDLLMGEDLKKTGAGNLFTVFGEPDIDVRHEDSDVVVELNGVDVYDPTTGELRSNDTGQIALWMIDTNYNGDSFFVRHCYFTGGGDPYKKLKAALKAEIDADAWASLKSTVSRPFAKPETGKIAVKVINDYGDEVMKVFEV